MCVLYLLHIVFIICYHQRNEISSLETKISEAKERYQHTVFSAKDNNNTMSALPQFPINDKFVLNQDEAWYTLSIELQVPIDTVMLQVCVCVCECVYVCVCL